MLFMADDSKLKKSLIQACNASCRGIEVFLNEIYHEDHEDHGSKLLKVRVNETNDHTFQIEITTFPPFMEGRRVEPKRAG